MVATAALQEPTDKQKLWLRYYTDESNSLTFLNGVQSALAAYNTTDYNTANQIAMDVKKAIGPYIDKWFDEEMFSEKALKNKVKQLMTSKDTKFIKVKGAVSKEELKPGQRIVCTSGVVTTEKDDNGDVVDVFGTGETLIAIDTAAKETQRRSADMAIKIKGMYAAEKLDVTGVDELAARLASGRKRIDGEDTAEGGDDDDLFS